MPVEERLCTVRPLTQGPRAHFPGNNDGSPWDASGRYALVLEAEADNRTPLPGEKAAILLVDGEKGAAQQIADSAAWNWQSGCRLQWLPSARRPEIIFNDVCEGKHVAVILDIQTGARRVLPRPIHAVSPDGKSALSINLARLTHLRPWQEYAGVRDEFVADFTPKNDGIWWMDLLTGESRLLVSIDQAVKFRPKPNMEDVKHRFDAVMLNPSGTRFLFLQRWSRLIGGRPFNERLWSCNTDGTDLHIVADHDSVPHFEWRDDTHILAWAAQERQSERYLLFTDRSDEVEHIGVDHLTEGGNGSYSPDRRWLAADTYPDTRTRRQLLLYELATDRRVNIGAFTTPPPFLRGELRCDLNPRWRADGKQLCFVSSHEGVRQVYAMDVSEVVG